MFVWSPEAVSNRPSLASQCVCCHSCSVAPAASRVGRGLCPSVFCVCVAPAPHGGLISVMILSLRPGTRQDPLKNSSGLFEGGVGLEPTCSGLQPDVYPFGQPPMVAGRAPPVKQTLYCAQNTACSPVHVYLISVVVAVVANLSGSVASAACRRQVWVASCASAVWAHDRLRLVVVDEF